MFSLDFRVARRAIGRLHRPLLLAGYMVLTTSGILLLMEGGLAVSEWLTNDARLSTVAARASSNGRTEPVNVLRIAVFGGSAAAGYNSERSFSPILELELSKRYPMVPVRVSNLARNSYPFYRHQAELLKSVIDDYDIFLIYAGNNEGWNYWDDVGYFRKEEFKNQRLLSPLVNGANDHVWAKLKRFLESYSRVYAVLTRAQRKYLEPRLPPRVPVHKNRRYQEFEAERALPPTEVSNVHAAFERALEEVASLAKSHGKEVIVSSIPTDETARPNFSTLSPELSAEERSSLLESYELGKEALLLDDYDAAISHFQKAIHIDPEVAILYYLIGTTLTLIGERAEGREYLRQSSDLDGFPMRSLTSLHRIAQSVSERHVSLHYVDTVMVFDQVLDHGVEHAQLFADIHHPSLAGHSLIAQSFLCELGRIGPFASFPERGECLDAATLDIGALASRYVEDLGISKADESQTAFSTARWFLIRGSISAYPEQELVKADEAIRRYYSKSKKTPEDKATFFLVRALIEAQSGASTLTALDLANQALTTSRAYVLDTVGRMLFTSGSTLVDTLEEQGIALSEGQETFVLSPATP